MVTFAPLLALLLAVPAAAGWRDIPASDFTMAPPPAAGSPEAAADYAKLLELQASRTKAQCDAAQAQKIPDFRSLFAGSGILSGAELKAVEPLVDEASKLLSKITGVFKKQFARPRPYDVDARVQPCIDKPGGATSYPSTHAASGVLDGCLLGSLFPKRANALTARGLLVGDLRAIAGVHHPSDLEAGRETGAALCKRLLAEPDFRAELDAVKQSLP